MILFNSAEPHMCTVALNAMFRNGQAANFFHELEAHVRSIVDKVQRIWGAGDRRALSPAGAASAAAMGWTVVDIRKRKAAESAPPDAHRRRLDAAAPAAQLKSPPPPMEMAAAAESMVVAPTDQVAALKADVKFLAARVGRRDTTIQTINEALKKTKQSLEQTEKLYEAAQQQA